MGGKTVPERMDAVAFLDAGLQLGKIVDSLGVVDRYRSALSVEETGKSANDALSNTSAAR